MPIRQRLPARKQLHWQTAATSFLKMSPAYLKQKIMSRGPNAAILPITIRTYRHRYITAMCYADEAVFTARNTAASSSIKNTKNVRSVRNSNSKALQMKGFFNDILS